jgi:hypothetical protein
MNRSVTGRLVRSRSCSSRQLLVAGVVHALQAAQGGPERFVVPGAEFSCLRCRRHRPGRRRSRLATGPPAPRPRRGAPASMAATHSAGGGGGEVIDLQHAQGILAAGDLRGGAQSDDLSDDDLDHGQRDGEISDTGDLRG